MENGNVPATKEDVAMLRSEMQHLHDHLVERIVDSETRLLQAFYGFAESVTKRDDSIRGPEALVMSRMASFETRLLDIEKRLN